VEPYARLVRQFCLEHPAVSVRIYGVPSAFNPIKELLPGVKADVEDLYLASWQPLRKDDLPTSLCPVRTAAWFASWLI
jgi:hypothetical protein